MSGRYGKNAPTPVCMHTACVECRVLMTIEPGISRPRDNRKSERGGESGNRCYEGWASGRCDKSAPTHAHRHKQRVRVKQKGVRVEMDVLR